MYEFSKLKKGLLSLLILNFKRLAMFIFLNEILLIKIKFAKIKNLDLLKACFCDI